MCHVACFKVFPQTVFEFMPFKTSAAGARWDLQNKNRKVHQYSDIYSVNSQKYLVCYSRCISTNMWTWCNLFLFANTLLISVTMHACFISHVCCPPHQTQPNSGRSCVRQSTSLLIHNWIPLKCSSCAFPSLDGMESNSLTLLCNPGFVKFLIMAESQLNSKSYYYTQCTILLLRYPADTHTNTHTEKSITLLLMSSTVRHVLTHIRKIPPIPLRKFHII